MDINVYKKVESAIENHGAETVLNEMLEWFSSDEIEEFINRFISLYE